MKHLQTLRVRFALGTAGLLMIALVFFGFLIYVNMAHSLTAVIDEALRPVVIQLMSEIELIGNELIVLENPIEDPEYAQLREQGFSVRVFNLAGQSVYEYGPYQRLPEPTIDLTIAHHPGEFTTINEAETNKRLRVYTSPIVHEQQVEGIIQVAQNIDNIGRTLTMLVTALLIGGPLIVVMAGGFGYFLAARALAPINEMISTARHISAADLSARLHLSPTEDEVGRLADTFNSMLARLEDAFRRQQQFTADASHELRTPLTAMQAIISGTRARTRTALEYEQALLDLNQEVSHMRTLVEGLLQLARNDASQPNKLDAINLSTLLKDVIESLRPLAEDKHLQLIENISDEALMLAGDSDALIRLFVNLVDNAIKYTSVGTVTIAANRTADDKLVVTITDTGVGIAPEHLPQIFNRFYRVDGARSTEGLGLGLAIALDAAHAHGGDITVESKPGTGTTFTVQLATK
jgi:heavy metal sensor kinase